MKPRSFPQSPHRPALWLAALALTACAPPSASLPITPTEVDDAVQRAFDDAACVCEAQLVRPGLAASSTRLALSSAAYAAGDTALGVYAARFESGVDPARTQCTTLSGRTARTTVPTVTFPPNERYRNGCVQPVAVDGSSAPWSYPAGFCRADVDYCIANELRLIAESISRPIENPEVRQAVLAESTRRMQRASATYAASLAAVQPTCALATPHAECERLNNGYADVAYSRMSDGAALSTDTVLSAVHDALAASDAMSLAASEPGAYTADVWGVDGPRLRAATILAGQPLLSATPGTTTGGYGVQPDVNWDLRSVSGGNVSGLTGLRTDQVNNARVQVVQERSDFVLQSDLVVQATGASTMTLRAGTSVNVILVHYDPPTTASATGLREVRFDRPVYGVLSTDAQLNNTDSISTISATVLPGGIAGRGVEAGDAVTVLRDRVWLNLSATGTTFDEVRILVPSSVPGSNVVVAAPRSGELPFAQAPVIDARIAQVVRLMARHGFSIPYAICQSAQGDYVMGGAPFSGSAPPELAEVLFTQLDSAVRAPLLTPDGTPLPATPILTERYSIRPADVRAAYDYLVDAAATLDARGMLAPPTTTTPWTSTVVPGYGVVTCWTRAIVRTETPVEQRSPMLALAALSRSATGWPQGPNGALPSPGAGSSAMSNYYGFDPAQLRRVGAIGAQQIQRHYLARLWPTAGARQPIVDESLAAIDAAIGPRWTEWRVCDTAGACEGDALWQGRFSLYERGTGSRLPAGRPVMVRNMADARCLIQDRATFATAAGCGHVRSSSYRYAELAVVATESSSTCNGAPGVAFGPYCRRSFRTQPTAEMPDLRTVLASEQRVVLWCEAPSAGAACTRYRLLDAIYLGMGSAHALGGMLGEALADVFAVDPNDPATPAETSLGLPPDLVPPLENELIEDGDGLEDSWRSYLDYATGAQVRATALYDEARTHEAEMLAYDRAAEASLEAAALEQQSTLSELCGATTTAASCDLPRATDPAAPGLGVRIADLNLIPDPGPMPDIHAASCEQALGAFSATNASSVDRSNIANLSDDAILCTHWLTITSVRNMRLADLPTVLVQELQRGGDGTYSQYGGELRQQLIALHRQLLDLRDALGDLTTSARTARANVALMRSRMSEVDDSWWETVSCFVRQSISSYQALTALVAAVSAVATGGATAPLLIAAIGAAVTVSDVASGFDACTAGDRERQRLATQLFGDTLTSVHAMLGFGEHAVRLVSSVASADGHLDSIAAQAGFAQARRDIEERLATAGYYGDPDNRLLVGYELRRARRAIERAQRFAFIARRAIEYRLGVDLRSMTSAEISGESPADWAGDVFVAHLAVETAPGQWGYPATVGIAGEATEDYVLALGDFVIGYPFAHRFSEGTDLAVVNLAELVERPAMPGGEPIVQPLSTRLIFQCASYATPLLGGVLPGTLVDPENPPIPCDGELGGVLSASLPFEVPAGLEGYFGERLASGSFNYRIERIAVNVVGRALFDCERAARPSECYGDGNVQYSLRQAGSVILEDHPRSQHVFEVEPGVILRARALADERWLTNPLSGADTALLAPYERAELWGRPLSGAFVLTVHGRPEMDWRNIENVQVLVRYRYWTRQE